MIFPASCHLTGAENLISHLAGDSKTNTTMTKRQHKNLNNYKKLLT